MRGDRIVRLTPDRQCGASQQLEVARRRHAKLTPNKVLDFSPDDGMRGREVQQLRNRRGGHGDSLRAAPDTTTARMSTVRPTLTRMSRSGLDPDTALDVLLSAMCSRNRYTRDAAAVIDELRATAGTRTDILARVAGSWVGYYGDEHTRTLCKALLEIPGAIDWVGHGRARRDASTHGAPMVRP